MAPGLSGGHFQVIDHAQRIRNLQPILAKTARKKSDGSRWRIYEVPISYSGRTYEEGKKIGMKDGFQALYCIIRYWLKD